MKRSTIQTLLFATSLTVVFSACREKASIDTGAEPILRPSSMVFSGDDSTQIHNAVKQFVEHLKQQDVDVALDMLYSYENNEIVPLNDSVREGLSQTLSFFNIYDARANAIKLEDKVNNSFDIMLQIMPDGDMSENKGVTHLVLGPVLVNGTWYLTLQSEVNKEVE